MRIVNLTGREIYNQETGHTYFPSGEPVAVSFVAIGDGARETANLPHQTQNTLYLVRPSVQRTVPNRPDVISYARNAEQSSNGPINISRFTTNDGYGNFVANQRWLNEKTADVRFQRILGNTRIPR